MHPPHCRSHRNAVGIRRRLPSTGASVGTSPRACSSALAYDILEIISHISYSFPIKSKSSSIYPYRCALWLWSWSCRSRVCRPWRRSPTSVCHRTTHRTTKCTCRNSRPRGLSTSQVFVSCHRKLLKETFIQF